MKRWLAALATISMIGCATTGVKEDALKGNGTVVETAESGTGVKGEMSNEEKAKTLFEEGLRLINGSPQSALKIFNEVTRLAPATWEAHYNAALANIRLHDFKKAEVELIKSLNKKAPPAKIYNALGSIHLYNGNRKKAIDTFETSLTNGKTAAALVNLAGIYNSIGQKEKAVKYYREAGAVDPANQVLYAALVSYSEGRYQSAREAFKTVMDNGHRDTKIMYLYAQTLLKTGDYNTALKTLQEVYAADSSDPNPYRDMGIIYEVYLGDLDKAVKNYNLYVSNGGENAKEVGEWVNIINMRLSQENKKDDR